MRTTLNISLPPILRRWVEGEVETGGYSTASEYIRQLIREQQKRQARLAIEGKLREAMSSGPAVPVTEETWGRSFKEVAQKRKSSTRSSRANGKNS